MWSSLHCVAGSSNRHGKGLVMVSDRRTLSPTEAQCPKCGRVFSTDRNCELHKRYLKGGGLECLDPAGIGLVSTERRGVPVWHLPAVSASGRRFPVGMRRRRKH